MSSRNGTYRSPARLGWTQTGLPSGSVMARGSLKPRIPSERAESVIERAVLLHEDDDVFGVEIAAAGGGFDGQRPHDRFWTAAQHARGARHLGRLGDEFASRVHVCVQNIGMNPRSPAVPFYSYTPFKLSPLADLLENSI